MLLSAICVQKPLLAFQQAKLAFEKELVASVLVYSIVRPRAFFKSLSGQAQRVKRGKPFFCLAMAGSPLANPSATTTWRPTSHGTGWMYRNTTACCL